MSHGGDGAQEALGVDGTLMIDMVVAQQVHVELRQDICLGILHIATAEDEEGRIDHQQYDDGGDGVAMVAEDGEHRDEEVAEGDALHDGHDAQVAKTQEVALDGVVEPVDEQADDKEQHRTLDDAAEDGGRRLELRLHQGQVAGDTHDEEEEGEHEVAGRHAVPLGMLEHFEGLAPAVVDKDHACHGDAAEDIET